MADYAIPKSGAAYIFYSGLVSQADTKLLKSGPTLAAGDFKVSIDGGALANMATLPTNTPSGTVVKFSLSGAEMTGDNITVVCIDAAGAEWCDQIINIQTAPRGVADLAYPATSGRSMVVDASGLVDANAVKVGPTGSGTAQTARDIGASVLLSSGTGTGQVKLSSGYVAPNWGDVGNPTTVVGLTNTTIATVTTTTTATNVTTVNGLAANVITATSIAADAIGASELATDAVQEIRNAITGGAYALSTDASGMIRVVDGTGAGEINTASGVVQANMVQIQSDAAALDYFYVMIGDGTFTADFGNSQFPPATVATGGISSASFAANSITAAAAAPDFGTEVGTAVWATTTRLLTAGTNIALAKGTGVTGFTDLSASDVRTAVGLGSANLDTQLDALPTNAELATAIITGLTAALTEGYRGTGATGSVRDMLYEIIAHMGESGISGTTKTLKKLDGSTTAKTYTLDADPPSSITETT